MHLDDGWLRCGGESRLFFLVSREFLAVVGSFSWLLSFGFVMGATMFTYLPFSGVCLRKKSPIRWLGGWLGAGARPR